MLEKLKDKALEELHLTRENRLNEVDSLTAQIEKHRTLMETFERHMAEVRDRGMGCRDALRVEGGLGDTAVQMLAAFTEAVDGRLDDVRPLEVKFKKSKLVLSDAEKTIGELIVRFRDEGRITLWIVYCVRRIGLPIYTLCRVLSGMQ